MITGTQIRMARAALDWSREDLAKKVGITATSIKNIESGDVVPRESSLKEIMRVFESAGLEFTEREGVRKKSEIVQTFDGRQALRHLFDDIYQDISASGGGDIFICGVRVKDYLTFDKEACDIQFKRLDDLGTVRQHVLSPRDMTDFVVPYAEYRWLDKQYAATTPFYVYGTKLAVILWGENVQVVIINHSILAEAYKKQFLAIWDAADIAAPRRK